MNAIPTHFPSVEAGASGGSARDPAGEKWLALLDAGAAIATLAEIAPDPPIGPQDEAVRRFPQALRAAGGWRRRMAENGIDDLAAIIEPGIAALLAVQARGADARPAARALWQEFEHARDTLLSLAFPSPVGPGEEE